MNIKNASWFVVWRCSRDTYVAVRHISCRTCCSKTIPWTFLRSVTLPSLRPRYENLFFQTQTPKLLSAPTSHFLRKKRFHSWPGRRITVTFASAPVNPNHTQTNWWVSIRPAQIHLHSQSKKRRKKKRPNPPIFSVADRNADLRRLESVRLDWVLKFKILVKRSGAKNNNVIFLKSFRIWGA